MQYLALNVENPSEKVLVKVSENIKGMREEYYVASQLHKVTNGQNMFLKVYTGGEFRVNPE